MTYVVGGILLAIVMVAAGAFLALVWNKRGVAAQQPQQPQGPGPNPAGATQAPMAAQQTRSGGGPMKAFGYMVAGAVIMVLIGVAMSIWGSLSKAATSPVATGLATYSEPFLACPHEEVQVEAPASGEDWLKPPISVWDDDAKQSLPYKVFSKEQISMRGSDGNTATVGPEGTRQDLGFTRTLEFKSLTDKHAKFTVLIFNCNKKKS